MKFLKSMAAVIGASVLLGTIQPSLAQDKTEEEKSKVHRLESTNRSTYDAFTYANRIPEAPGDGESPLALAGRIFGRLANQEGRILLKLPPGMDKEGYLAFKTFFQYEGEASVGNCGACHVPRNFDSASKFVTTKGGTASVAPSLRNLKARGVDIKAAVESKVAAAKQKQSGDAPNIDDAFSVMKLNDADVAGLVKFLNLLNDGPEEEFRQLILNAEILDTSDFF